MILNQPVAVGIDVAAGKYAINLQLSWPQTGADTNTVPGLAQLLGTGAVTPLFPNAFVDVFDARRVQGNIVLPPIRTITGTVVWQGMDATDLPGFFHIVEGSQALVVFSFRPSVISYQIPVSAVFAVPVTMPTDGSLAFYRNANTEGRMNGCANLTLLTWEIPSFFGGN